MRRLEVIVGPMFSGKSEELIRRLSRLEIARKPFLAIKPEIDVRFGMEFIRSHSGATVECKLMQLDSSNFWDIVGDYQIIAIDEVQFFSEELLQKIDSFIDRGGYIIVSGLDMTYRKEPFGIVPHLMAVADSITKLNAVCHKCGEEAIYTQRLVNGLPAPFSGTTVQVGGTGSYEARCRSCFEPGS